MREMNRRQAVQVAAAAGLASVGAVAVGVSSTEALGAGANDFVTIWISSNSKSGTLALVGTWDVNWGFTLDEGPKTPSRFQAAGIQLIPKKNVKLQASGQLDLSGGDITLVDDPSQSVLLVKTAGSDQFSEQSNFRLYVKYDSTAAVRSKASYTSGGIVIGGGPDDADKPGVTN
jgi:hypothetical protein